METRMYARQIWAAVGSGEQYVVELDREGAIFAAAGPLHYSEVAAALAGDFNPDPEVADDLANDGERYGLVAQLATE